MKYIKNTLDFHVEEPTVISLGKFDGIHRGHELLMEKLAQKKEEGLKAAIFTFDIPPKKNVEHIEARVLTTNEEKMHIFEGIGIDYLIECPFTREVMCMEPEDFIRMLVEKLNVKCIVAGEDFHFGHNRRGDYQMLKRYAPVYGYEALILSKMKEIIQKHIRQRDLLGLVDQIVSLLVTGNTNDRQLKALFNYVLQTGDAQRFRAFIGEITERAPQEKEKLMTIADRLREEGAMQGKHEEALRIAQEMLDRGLDRELVMMVTRLSPDDLIAQSH